MLSNQVFLGLGDSQPNGRSIGPLVKEAKSGVWGSIPLLGKLVSIACNVSRLNIKPCTIYKITQNYITIAIPLRDIYSRLSIIWTSWEYELNSGQLEVLDNPAKMTRTLLVKSMLK